MPVKRKAQPAAAAAAPNKAAKTTADEKKAPVPLPVAELAVVERWIRTEVERRVNELTKAKSTPLTSKVACVQMGRIGEDDSVWLHSTEEEALVQLLEHQIEKINATLYEDHATLKDLRTRMRPDWVSHYFESVTVKAYNESRGYSIDPKDDDTLDEPVVRLKSVEIPSDELQEIEQVVCGTSSSFVQKQVYIVE